MRTRFLLSAVCLAAAGTANAGTVLSEGFDSVAALAAAGWVFTNNSAPAGGSWFQGNPAPGIFPAAAGAASSYVAADYNSAGLPGGAISNWLLTPVVAMTGTTVFSYALRLLGDGFTDTVQVYYSTSGASANVGTTTTSTGVFTLLDSFSTTADTGWVTHTNPLAGLTLATGATGRFAFRYVVGDTNLDGNYVGIDTAQVIPEPTSFALLGLGLAAAGVATRRKAR